MNLNKALQLVINCRCTDYSTTKVRNPAPRQAGLNECKNDSKLAQQQKESFALIPGTNVQGIDAAQEAPLPDYIV